MNDNTTNQAADRLRLMDETRRRMISSADVMRDDSLSPAMSMAFQARLALFANLRNFMLTNQYAPADLDAITSLYAVDDDLFETLFLNLRNPELNESNTFYPVALAGGEQGGVGFRFFTLGNDFSRTDHKPAILHPLFTTVLAAHGHDTRPRLRVAVTSDIAALGHWYFIRTDNGEPYPFRCLHCDINDAISRWVEDYNREMPPKGFADTPLLELFRYQSTAVLMALASLTESWAKIARDPILLLSIIDIAGKFDSQLSNMLAEVVRRISASHPLSGGAPKDHS